MIQGAPRAYHAIKVPMRDSDGGIAGICGIARDTTERRLAQEELGRQRDRLEQLVQERTVALRRSVAEKEVLLREIHHRVKNNMQIMSSLLALQAGTVSNERAREALRESRDRVRAMSRVHEQLYQTEDVARIDMGRYIRSLTGHLSQSFGADVVTTHVKVRDVSLDIDNAVPCGLIINELVSNAFAHAFPNRSDGKITVSLDSTDGTYQLCVRDDGVGLPAHLDPDHPASLGLRLVHLLARQLNGSVCVDIQQGTAFKITFSAAQHHA